MLRICALSFLISTAALAQSGSPSAIQTPGWQDNEQRPHESTPEIEELRPVPHGDLRTIWYDSKTYGVQRRLHIYTPPGYNHSKTKFPVLYLIHGGGGQDDATWFAEARIGFVLDNLIAANKIKPMVVVTPNGNGIDPNMNRPGASDTPEYLAARVVQAANTRDSFVSDLMIDIIPYVESGYRVRTDSKNRAIAGFSFGGTESLWAGTSYPEKFAWIGVISMGLQVGSRAGPGPIAGAGTGSPEDFVRDKAVFFSDALKTNKLIKLFWIGVGNDDAIVANGPKQLSDTLTTRSIRNQYREVNGIHSLENARLLLVDFLPLLFR